MHILLKDIKAYSGDNFNLSGTLKTILFRRGFHSMCLYRIYNFLKDIKFLGYIPARVLWYLNCSLYGNDLSMHARIAGGVRLPHPHGILIGDRVHIKQGATILQNVTLGSKHSHKGLQNTYSMVLEENVFVGAGAVLLGDITVGANSLVGANAVVIKDIPENSVAVGVPAIIKPISG